MVPACAQTRYDLVHVPGCVLQKHLRKVTLLQSLCNLCVAPVEADPQLVSQQEPQLIVAARVPLLFVSKRFVVVQVHLVVAMAGYTHKEVARLTGTRPLQAHEPFI